MANRSHVVLDPGTLDASVEVVAEFVGVVAGELTPEEGGDVVGLDRVDGRADQRLIQGAEVGLAMEDDVGGVLDLHEAPVIGSVQLFDYRAIEPGIFIKTMMKFGNIQAVR